MHVVEFKHGKDTKALYLFTRATRSGASDGSLLHGVGNGTWRASYQRTLVYCDGAVIKQKIRNLKFMLPAEKEGNKPMATSWIMHEYRIIDSLIDGQGKEMML